MPTVVKNNLGHIITIVLLLIGIGVNWGTIQSFMWYQKEINSKVDKKIDDISQTVWEIKGKISR